MSDEGADRFEDSVKSEHDRKIRDAVDRTIKFLKDLEKLGKEK